MRRVLPLSALLAASVLAAACGDDSPVDPDACTVRYERLGNASSERVDVVVSGDEPLSVKRLVREDGDEVTAAIYYRHAGTERIAEELDDGDDGTIDAVLRREERLGDLVDVFQVDADTDDDQLDTVQLSVALPTSRFGSWAPARMFYAMSCGPNHTLAAERVGDIVTIQADLQNDGSIDSEMRLYVVDGNVTAWVIDHGMDGVIDARAVAEYNADGLIEQVTWRDWEFKETHIARWEYDESGELAAYEEDAEADGDIDNRISYSATCWESEEADEEVFQ